MINDDASRWNQRYSQEESKWQTEPRDWLVDHTDFLPKNGVALDLAMGLGQNAGYLVSRGWEVIGVDISSVAAINANNKYPEMLTIIANLPEIHFCDQSFDLILNFYFLQRNLLSRFVNFIKPGGYLLLETLTQPIQLVKPEIPSEYLLQDGELRELFAGWNIIDYREGWFANSSQGNKSIASIFAQWPGD